MSALTDNAGRIDADVLCVECGYNLRTMMGEAACPECGRSAQISLRTWRGEFDDPKWLRAVRSGIVLILISLLWEMTIEWISEFAFYLNQPLWSGYFLGYGSWLPWVLGLWRCTTPRPGLLGLEKQISARRIARWCGLFAVIPDLVSLALFPLFLHFLSPSRSLDWAMLIAMGIYILYSALMIASLIGLAVYAQAIVSRYGAKRLRLYLLIAVIGWIAGMILELLLWLPVIITGDVTWLWGVYDYVVLIWFIPFGLLGAVVMIKLFRLLKPDKQFVTTGNNHS